VTIQVSLIVSLVHEMQI